MSLKLSERIPHTVSELMNFREVKQTLETTYLNIARAIIVTRKEMGLSDHESLQVVLLYADGAIFESMVQDIQKQYPEGKISIVSKPLSRVVINRAAMGPVGTKEWSRAQANELLTKIMLEDNRLGTFSPEMPTLWIDSSVSLSFVKLAEKVFTKVPLGNPAFFFSVNAIETASFVGQRFQKVFSPLTLSSQIEQDSLSSLGVEAWLRLPITKSDISFQNEPHLSTLEFSEERNQTSAFYPANVWCLGKEYESRRKHLLNQAKTLETYETELQNINPQQEDL